MTPYYQREGVTLYNADCRDVLPTLGRVDCVITDPPHSERTHKGARGICADSVTGIGINFESISDESLCEAIRTLVSMCDGWVVASIDWRHMATLEEQGLLVRFGVWIKPNGAPQYTGDRPATGWEAVAICHHPGKKKWNGGGHHATWVVNRESQNTQHPTQKPKQLIREWLRLFSNPNDLILDPFTGSGTTAVACIEMKRRFIGAELSREYCDVAVERIETAFEKAKQMELAL